MEATPAEWAVLLLQWMGVWAKPWAVAGGVACLVAGGGLGAVVHARLTNRYVATALIVLSLMLGIFLLLPHAEPTAFLPALILRAAHLRSSARPQAQPRPAAQPRRAATFCVVRCRAL